MSDKITYGTNVALYLTVLMQTVAYASIAASTLSVPVGLCISALEPPAHTYRDVLTCIIEVSIHAKCSLRLFPSAQLYMTVCSKY